MEDAIISGITHTIDEAYVTLTDVPDKPGTAASIFNAVAAAHINVDTIIQNAVTHGDADVTFSIPTDDLPLMTDTIEGSAATSACTGGWTTRAAKVSLIGAGMKSHPGVAAKMFQTLAEHDINVRMIATSPIKVSCVIARERVPEAVSALHERVRRRARGLIAGGRPCLISASQWWARPARSAPRCSRSWRSASFPASRGGAVRLGPLGRHSGWRSRVSSSRCGS